MSRLAPACLRRLFPFVLLAATCAAQGQTFPDPTASLDEQRALAAEQARRQVTDRILATGGVPLEGAVDPTEYIVGPGDVFSVSTGGIVPFQFTPAVTADGVLVIPEVGSFPVAGLSLAEARGRIGAALQRAYRNVPTDVALAQPRKFYVHVSGEVERPGRHVAVPVARVEDALAAAMAGSNPLQAFERQKREDLQYERLPALRNVVVQRKNGDRLVVDLMKYYATGDTEHNPYLRDGDRIYVPSFASDGEAVFVEFHTREALNRARAREQSRASRSFFDYRPGDTVADLLLVAGGPELLAETGTVRLLRSEGDGLSVHQIDVQAIREGTAAAVPIQPRDRLLVTGPAAPAGVAEAEGLVVHPGTYPIVPGKTTLRELVAAAGGIRADGLLRAAYLERRGVNDTEQNDPALEIAEDPDVRAALVEEGIFQETRLTDLPFVSRRYLTRELLQYQRVTLELNDDPGAIPDVTLRDGDRFVVPRDPGAVLVVGQVRNPGYVPFAPGADAAYYIAQAGGRGPAAAGIYVRDGGSGALIPPDESPIRSGDAVFVDRVPMADTEALQALSLQERQLNFQLERERSDQRFRYIQTGLAVLGTAVSVITTYLLIRDSTSN